jgi:hypothetical protein
MAGFSVNNIATPNYEIPKPVNHPFNATFEAAVEDFASKGFNIAVPDGMTSVFGNGTAFEDYKENVILDGVTNEDARESISLLLDRAAAKIVNDGGQVQMEDGSVGNSTVFAYLNGPVIRAVWARCIIPAVMKVVALKQPTYTLTYDLQFLVDSQGQRHDLPYSLVDGDGTDGYVTPMLSLTPLIMKKGGNKYIVERDGVVQLINGSAKGNLIDDSLANARSAWDGRHVDVNAKIKNVKYIGESSVPKDGNGAQDPTKHVPGDLVTFEGATTFVQKPGAAGEMIAIINLPDAYVHHHNENKVAASEKDAAIAYLKAHGQTVADPTAFDIPIAGLGEVADVDDNWALDEGASIVVILNCSTGEWKAMSTSASIESFEFEAYLSSEDNRDAAQMLTEQASLNVNIGTGQHIMIDTPVELLQDYAPSHQGADYTVAMTDIVSEFYAGHKNCEYLNFMRNSLQNPESNAYISQQVLRGLNIKDAKFDIRVAHGENPKSYVNTMLKDCVTYWVNEIRETSRIEDGFWSIVGKANNVRLLKDFITESYEQLNADSDAERKDVLGFKVGYTFGFMTNGLNAPCKALYTPEMRQRKDLVIAFTSTDPKRPTYIYHPYSFVIARSYQNKRTDALVPSLMVMKRDLFKEFVPSQIKLEIAGNDGNQFRNGGAVLGA